MTSPLTCPFCDSPDVELVSAWGGQLITSQMRCRSCNTHFEAVREDLEPRDERWTPS
jgi:transposase-like protein